MKPIQVPLLSLTQTVLKIYAWRLPFQNISVIVDPNIIKNVEIPINVAGEASGTVSIDKEGEVNGLGRIIMNFFTSDNKLIGKTLSEDDGYYSYFGFVPGHYFVRIDTAQLRKLGMITEKDSLHFNILPGIEGDFVEKLDFVLKMKPEEKQVLPEKPVSRKDTTRHDYP